MPGSKVNYDIEQRIISYRRAGYTCRETARVCGVTEATVWYRMRKAGLNGKLRGRSSNTAPRNIGEAVERYGVVTIETGADDGYIVTIDDETTGPERGTIQGAIYAAARLHEEER